MTATPEQIKQALKCCNVGEVAFCDQCPYSHLIEYADDEICSEKMARDAIALIDRLRKSNGDLADAILKKEDMMQEMHTKNQQLSDRLVSARIDSYREFQKKTKEKFVAIDGTFECSEVEELIDETAAELEEEIYNVED